MGCDGGTIPKRDELVKTKKRPEKKDRAAERAFRWQNCAITQAPLQQPVVACELGRLYSKESVIESLLDKASEAEPNPSSSNGSSDITSHIKSLRDVKALNLTENPDWTEASSGEKGDGYIDMQKSKWICPISGQEMSGLFRFVFIWTCGCVMSEKALKEMNKNKKEGGHACLKCQKPFEVSDVILLNPTEPDDISTLQEKMEARRSKAKDLKKSKKKSAKSEEASSSSNGVATGSSTKDEKDPEATSSSSTSKLEKRKLDKNGSIPASVGNGTSTSVQANGNGNGSGSSKKSKIEANGSNGSLSSASKITSYSVAKDPNASSTYKSLFTSSEKAKDQQRAHWVTYNPFYN